MVVSHEAEWLAGSEQSSGAMNSNIKISEKLSRSAVDSEFVDNVKVLNHLHKRLNELVYA